MTSISEQEPRSLQEFILQIVAVPSKPWTADEPPWFEPSINYQIDEATYWHYLELLPPRWDHGDWFAFGEGAGPFRLFWKQRDCYFARELTDEETRLFCKLSCVRLDQ